MQDFTAMTPKGRPSHPLQGTDISKRPTRYIGIITVGPVKGDWFAGSLDSDTYGIFPCTGNSGLPIDGARVAVVGKWTEHPRFGEQFRIETIRLEDTEAAAHLWLTSGVLKGVGPKLARRIITKWGAAGNLVFDHMNEEDLRRVKGVGPKNVQWILESWEVNKTHAKASSFGLSIGLSLRESKRAYQLWGDEMREVIEQHPYYLIMLDGVSFRRADQLALSLGHYRHSVDRYEAGTLQVLRDATRFGHTGLPAWDGDNGFTTSAWREARKLLGNDVDKTMWATTLADREHDDDRMVELIREEDGITYLADRKLYLQERELADDITRLVESTVNAIAITESQIDLLSEPLTLAPQQREALKMALQVPIMALTGGPGTGKTTVLRVILDVFEKVAGLNVVCASPTGKAAQRMKEATGRDASTIHRLLDWKGEFLFNTENQLDADVVVLDEVSMMDTSLAWATFQAVKDGTRLLLVGDADQLPAVGPGQVFRDILDAGSIPCVRLEEVHRQAAGSGIVQNANRLNHGRPMQLYEEYDDFRWHPGTGVDELLQSCCNWVAQRLPEIGFSLRETIVLAPYRKHVAVINRTLQDRLNHNPRHRFGPHFFLSQDDPVIHTKNNYDLHVFNGECGIVVKVWSEEAVKEWRKINSAWTDPPPAVSVQFSDRLVQYPLEYVKQLQLAYAITIHKSQGSEFPCVVLALPKVHPGFLKRELPYTAITRAKSLLVLVGDPEVLPMLQRAESRAFRHTWLKEFLVDDNS